jgi:hypothetical protein
MLLAIGVFIMIGPNALAETWSPEWTYITSSDKKIKFYVKKNSIKALPPGGIRSFGVRQIWAGFDYSAVKSVRIRRSIRLYSYDCAAERSSLISLTDYLPNGAIASSYSDKIDNPYIYEAIVPETVNSEIAKVACLETPGIDLRPPLDSFFSPN